MSASSSTVAVYIGAYSTEVDAAKAHDLVSIRIGGLKALTNCHVRCHSKDMDEMRRMSKWDYICAIRGCNEDRFEAFVWDKSDPGEKGRTGAYSTEVDAAKAHDLVSIRIGGLKALTNCHVRCHSKDMDEMRRMSKWDYICAIRGILVLARPDIWLNLMFELKCTWHVCDYALGLFVGSAIENNYTNISSYNQSCDFTYAAYTWICDTNYLGSTIEGTTEAEVLEKQVVQWLRALHSRNKKALEFIAKGWNALILMHSMHWVVI
ncbi:AP2-like factor [Vigna unguiculata]|uniref:AP2-like factor n=1 Tax=Vigna unguiculata TaxID=3917 RepID=A0A4D6KNI0_VIGUN|nr:AP2-like factor [Vigna unguiculata]